MRVHLGVYHLILMTKEIQPPRLKTKVLQRVHQFRGVSGAHGNGARATSTLRNKQKVKRVIELT